MLVELRARPRGTKKMGSSTSTTTPPSISSFSVNNPNFSDGDILISMLLSVLILIHIFGALHNSLIGIKVKRTQYD